MFIQIPLKSSYIKVKFNAFIIACKTLCDLVSHPFSCLISFYTFPAHSAETAYSFLCWHFPNIHFPSGKGKSEITWSWMSIISFRYSYGLEPPKLVKISIKELNSEQYLDQITSFYFKLTDSMVKIMWWKLRCIVTK